METSYEEEEIGRRNWCGDVHGGFEEADVTQKKKKERDFMSFFLCISMCIATHKGVNSNQIYISLQHA